MSGDLRRLCVMSVGVCLTITRCVLWQIFFLPNMYFKESLPTIQVFFEIDSIKAKRKKERKAPIMVHWGESGSFNASTP